jgi:hypothetical protein
LKRRTCASKRATKGNQIRIARIGVKWEARVASVLDRERPDLETLAAVIARSAIVVARPVTRWHLPAGFEDLDLAILDWIATEAACGGRHFVPM